MHARNICLYFDFEFSSCMACSKARVNTPRSCVSYKVINNFFLNINLGEEMAGVPSPDRPSFGYAYNLGFEPTLGMAEHPYPSIVSNIF